MGAGLWEYLSNLIQCKVSLPWQGAWDEKVFKVPSNLSVVLWYLCSHLETSCSANSGYVKNLGTAIPWTICSKSIVLVYIIGMSFIPQGIKSISHLFLTQG